MSLAKSAEHTAFAQATEEYLRRLARGADTTDDATLLSQSWASVDDALGLLQIRSAADDAERGSWADVSAALEVLGSGLAVGGLPAVLAGQYAAQLTSASVGADERIIPTWVGADCTWHVDGGRVQPAGPGADSGLIVVPPAGPYRLLVPVIDPDASGLWLTEPIEHQSADVVPAIDLTQTFVRLPQQPVPATQVHSGDPAELIELTRAIYLMLLAVEAVGSADYCLRTAIDYLKVREQFGRILASMQGLKHLAADLYRQVEPLRSVAYAAVDAADRDDRAALTELAVCAKYLMDRTYPTVAIESVQMHGGIGFSWEMGLHRHYKRAVTNRVLGLQRSAIERRLGAYAVAEGGYLGSFDHRAEDEQQTALRVEVRAWIEAHKHQAPPVHGAHESMAYQRTDREEQWLDLLRAGRWLCLSWPPEYGGRGLDAMSVITVNEEFARAGIPRSRLGMGETLVAPAILAHGTPEQKSRLLTRIYNGTDIYCQGFSEPEHGSDLAHITTSGVVDGDQIRINGRKIWQSGAHRANRIFLLCRTNPEANPHAGISYVLADMPDNGITVEPIRMMPGVAGYNQVTFEDAMTSTDEVIGGLHNGWKVAMTTLGAERTGEITSQYLGYYREFRTLVDQLAASDRLDDSARARLADLYVEIVTMKANGLRVVDEILAGGQAAGLLSIDKLNWSEYHVRFGREAADLLGLDGIVRPEEEGYALTLLQRVMLESPGRRIARGTNQIQRNIIAERTLGMPK